MKSEKVINPATGQVIAEVPCADENQIKDTVTQAREAFDHGPWPKFSLAQRKEYLLKMAQGIMDRAQELARLETENTGKPIKETTFMDIPSSAKTFEYFAHNLERYLEVKKIDLDSKGESQLLLEPRGVTVLIAPWNYPLLIGSWKMAQSLAAGNTVILKPSSLTPLTALELAKIARQADLPEGVVNVLNAKGSEVGPVLCADPRIDLISFTGSTQTGQEIMRVAAQNTKKLIMELGGKSASIILADCDLATAVNGTLSSIFLNQGQMCTAMSRILVDKKIAAKFVEQFVEKAKRLKLGNGLEHQTQMGPLMSRQQREKIIAYVEQGKREGAQLLCGGRIPQAPELKDGFFFEPTVFGNVSPKMGIFQEEIFGPLTCIAEFSDEQEAQKMANDSCFGLACCIWSKDLKVARDLSRKINAGTIWINTYGMFHNEAPYGGFKQSGFGKELGQEGFLEYTRLKHVNYDTSGEKPLVSQWYAFG